MIRFVALLTTMLLLTVACSGGSDTDTAQVASPNPTATPKPEHLLDFEDIEQNVNEVSRIAWEDSQRIMALNTKTSSAKVELLRCVD